MKKAEFVIGVDVGTGSARAGIFDLHGVMQASSSVPIQLFQPATDFVEQSSEDIWHAIGNAIKSALKDSGIKRESIIGISYDATCSLVALDGNDKPITVSPTGRNSQNIIVWMDHRAIDQVNRINKTQHPVLNYVGKKMSPEMELPKLLWLKESIPSAWKKATKYLDLSDYLTYQSTGKDIRSLCTTVCKWTYLGHEGTGGKWDKGFLQSIGLLELIQKDKIGTTIWPMGKPIGGLTEQSAKDLGLNAGTTVGVGIIDAHAGGLGVIGMGKGTLPSPEELETNLALIGGTSTCHMAVSRKPKFINGIWGPYYSAMIPGMWLTEGGQSATGALIDHVINNGSHFHTLKREMKHKNQSIYEVLNNIVEFIQHKEKSGPEITTNLHVLDYYYGNRSPRADANARGMISGLTLDNSVESMARLYYATIQSIAYGTRHIIEEMNKKGYRISHIHACGGGTKNPLWLQEHADITGCDIVLPKEPEAVLLGTAMLAAVASGRYSTIPEAMSKMSRAGKTIKTKTSTRKYHDKKYKIYKLMYSHQLEYRNIME